MSNEYDISSAVTDMLYDMRDFRVRAERAYETINGNNVYKQTSLVLPEWNYDENPKAYIPLRFPPLNPDPDDPPLPFDPREFEIVEPGQIIGADDMHETWICYEPMETRYDYGANAGSGTYAWSAHGGGLIRLCCVSGDDRAEALQFTAANVWDRFRNGKVLSRSGSPVRVVCTADPVMNPIMVDKESKLLCSMRISIFARPS